MAASFAPLSLNSAHCGTLLEFLKIRVLKYYPGVKIALWSHSSNLSGAPIYLVTLANYLLENGHKVCFLYSGPPGAALQRLSPLVEIREFKLESRIFVERLFDWMLKRVPLVSRREKAWRKLLDDIGPDLVILNTLYWSELTTWSTKLGYKHVRIAHEPSSVVEKITKSQWKRLRAGNTVSVSTALQETLERHGLPVSDGIYPWLPRSSSASYRAPVAQKRRFIGVGGDAHRKGVDFAAEIAEKLNICVDWYGISSSPSRNIVAKGVVGIDFSMYTDLLLLSRDEPWGIVAMEALEHGLRVFGWDELEIIRFLKSFNLADGAPSFDIFSLSELIVAPRTVDHVDLLSLSQGTGVYRNFERLLNDLNIEVKSKW